MYNLDTSFKYVCKCWVYFAKEAFSRSISPHIKKKELSVQITMAVIAAFLILEFKGLEAVMEKMNLIVLSLLSCAIFVFINFFWNLLKIPVEIAQKVKNSESAQELITKLTEGLKEGKKIFDDCALDSSKLDKNAYDLWKNKIRTIFTDFRLTRYLDYFDKIIINENIEMMVMSKDLQNRTPTFWQNETIQRFNFELNVIAFTIDSFAPFTVAIRKKD